MTVDTAIGNPGCIPSAWQVFRRNRMSVVGLWLLVAYSSWSPCSGHSTPPSTRTRSAPARAQRMVAPNLDHPMGTDELGRDIFSRVLEGMRTSLLVGLVRGGDFRPFSVSSWDRCREFIGRWIDDAADAPHRGLPDHPAVLPGHDARLVLRTEHLQHRSRDRACSAGPNSPAFVRSEFLSLRSRQYVDAARVAGASDTHLVFVQILPNALWSGDRQRDAADRSGAILLEAGLSYLGAWGPIATRSDLGV